MQSKTWSMIETCSNVAIGYFVAVLAQIVIFPFFDINIPIESNMAIGAFFTMVSIIRSYAIRRLFNRREL